MKKMYMLTLLFISNILLALLAYADSPNIRPQGENVIAEYVIEPDTNATLNLPLYSPPSKLNPVSSNSEIDWEILGLIFPSFTVSNPFDYTNFLSDLPWILSSPPVWTVDLSENISYWTIQLRDDIYFFDGAHLTSDDVVFTFDLIKWIYPYSDKWKELGEILINATKVDTYTVKIFLNTTSLLRSQKALIIVFPKHIYEVGSVWGGSGTFPTWDVAPQQIVNHVAMSPSDPILTGYGPFKLSDWSPNGPCCNAKEFLFERYSNYFLRAVNDVGEIIWPWHELDEEYIDKYGIDSLRGPYVKYLRYKVVSNNIQVVEYLKSGDIDMASGAFLLEFYDELLSDGFTIGRGHRLYIGQLLINTKDFPLSESPFRRALAYALNKYAISRYIYSGLAEPIDCIIPRSLGMWSVEYMGLAPCTYIESLRDKAIAELMKANLTDSDDDGWVEDPSGSEISLELLIDNEARLRFAAEIIKKNIEDIGIHITLKFLSPKIIVYLLSTGDYEIAYYEQTIERLPYALDEFSSWGLCSQLARWSNDTYDDLVSKALYKDHDINDIKLDVWGAEIILYEEQPSIPLYQVIKIGAYKSYKRFGTSGWAGVLKDLIDRPVVNIYTIHKCARPKSISTTYTTIPTYSYNLTTTLTVNTTITNTTTSTIYTNITTVTTVYNNTTITTFIITNSSTAILTTETIIRSILFSGKAGVWIGLSTIACLAMITGSLLVSRREVS